MKKKIILCLSCGVPLLSVGLGSALMYFEKATNKNGILNVNGKDIASKNVTIRKEKFSNSVLPFPNSFIAKISELFSKGYYYHTDLPLTEVLKGLGMNVEWIDNNIANITLNEKNYVLDLEEVSLIETGEKFNLISSTDGGRRAYKVLDKELILDDNTIKNALYLIGEMIDVRIDFDESVVYITERTN